MLPCAFPLPHLFLPPLFILLFSIYFINIHTLTCCLCYTTQLSHCICSVSNISYLMTNFWGKLPHVAFQRLLVICGLTGQWWRPKVWLRCLFTLSFPLSCKHALFRLSLFQNCHFNFLSTLPFFHVSLIAILFETGSCLCLQSAF